MPEILRARNFAAHAHHGQTRKYTGEPYFNHCEDVAHLVEASGGDKTMIAAASLHDTIEDTDLTRDPSAQADVMALREDLTSALQELSPKLRAVVLLRDVATLGRLAAGGALRGQSVNLGGIHHADGRERDTVDRTPKATPVLPPEVARQVVDAMSGVTGPGGTAPAARQDFVVYGKTGTTNDSTDAWFIGCTKEPQNVCIATWMGYEDQNCNGIQGRNCGGMKNVNGVRQVYGGTLPAKIFDRTWEILAEIRAKKAAMAAGAPAPAPAVEATTASAPAASSA
ncbi:MAG: HD domain-containing protein [Proteobacteria bacterium]|nr:HD domain-containing protein [Pseudomonadota bacterium]